MTAPQPSPRCPQCKWCISEGPPEWSKHAKVWIHRRPTLDKACLNPPKHDCCPACGGQFEPHGQCSQCGEYPTPVAEEKPRPTDEAKTIGEFLRHDSDTCPCKVCVQFRADYPPREQDGPSSQILHCDQCGTNGALHKLGCPKVGKRETQVGAQPPADQELRAKSFHAAWGGPKGYGRVVKLEDALEYASGGAQPNVRKFLHEWQYGSISQQKARRSIVGSGTTTAACALAEAYAASSNAQLQNLQILAYDEEMRNFVSSYDSSWRSDVRGFVPKYPVGYQVHSKRIATLLAEGLHDGKAWKDEAFGRYNELEEQEREASGTPEGASELSSLASGVDLPNRAAPKNRIPFPIPLCQCGRPFLAESKLLQTICGEDTSTCEVCQLEAKVSAIEVENERWMDTVKVNVEKCAEAESKVSTLKATYMGLLDEAGKEVKRLEGELREARRLLNSERGGHLVFCNADHAKPIGAPMCVCSPSKLYKRVSDLEGQLRTWDLVIKEQKAELERLRAGERGLAH